MTTSRSAAARRSAIAGQLAGPLGGASTIPPVWRDRVAWEPRITQMAEALWAAGLEGR